MNNYSFLQKLLHKLALGSQMMRETAFDIEQGLFGKNLPPFEDHHVFVAGLARSGTTILLNALYESEEFASLSYEDMPFILSPMLWKKLRPNAPHMEAVERAHGDGIKVSTNSPEAFEEVFWKTFDDSDDQLAKKFKRYIQSILAKKNKSRYLSKNNQNIRRLVYLSRILPHSVILVPFRDPTQHAFSLLSQHRMFSQKQREDKFTRDYMNYIGHSEFGLDYRPIVAKELEHPDTHQLNHWLEQWFKVYENVKHTLNVNREIFPICYERLCDDSNIWMAIQELVGIRNKKSFIFVNKKKNIDEVCDQKLLQKCVNLYHSLQEKSVSSLPKSMNDSVYKARA